jgi:two-component system response regulator AtoC
VLWDGGAVVRPLEEPGVITLGRSAEVDVQIDHPSISRRHLAVHVGDTVLVEDLGSSNGTRLGGVRLKPQTPTPLMPGQVVELGVAMVVVQGKPGGRRSERRIDLESDRPDAAPSPMAQVRRLVELVAASDLSVLVLGETGAGKEVVAATIHERSARAKSPFLKVNCAALSGSLLEGELFGYERGAFTGAVRSKVGLIEAAEGGTLLLDEVGEMPEPVQAALLRVVETHEATRLGNVVPKRIDVRFLAATNRDLDAGIAAGRFRQDLYYRLNGITITVPPLRERGDEVAELARRFVDEAATRMRRARPPLTEEAIAALERHTWPGNVRELRAVVERAVVLSEGAPIRASHVLLQGGGGSPAPSDERGRLIDALERCCGNQTRAAKLLGISRRTLVTRIDEYGLPRPRKGS